MSRRRFRVRTSLVAAAVTVGSFLTPMVNPTDANASILPGPTTSLSAGFHNNPASLVQALLCPLVTVVKTVTSTIPGVNVLTDQLANIICALNVLGYVYRITYYPTAGPPQVRYYSALVGVPALLDVDGNGLPDTIGLVTPNAGLNIVGLQLQITRFGLPPTAHAKVEAVFIDPVDATHTTYVGLGEDGSVAGLAANWRVVVGAFLSSLTGPTVDLQAQIFTSQPPSTLTTFGEALFGDNPDAPTTIYAGQLNFTPMQNMTVRLAIGSSSQEADVTTTGPTVLGAHVQAITPGDEKDIDVTVDQLPTAIAIIHQTSNGHEQIAYSANSTINHITGQYHDRHGSSIITAAQADITSLPSAFTLDLFDSKVNFNVPVGAIGNVEVRFATNHEVPASPAGTAPYVAFHRFTNSHLEAGLRIGNIKSVSFDSGGPYFGDLVFSVAPGYIPLSFEDDVSGITAVGHLSNLPAHLTVTIDMTGHVVFDGHGTGIDEIFIHATKSPGTFFTKANRVDLTIDGLPALDTIDFTPDGTTVNFTPSAPIGSVQFLASDGTDAPSVVGDYASYEDTPSLYRLYVQMLSIAGVSFSTSPTMHATLKTGTPQQMVLHAHIADAAATHNITFDGSITNLPTTIDVNADLDNGKVVYNASSVINDIHFHATDSAANFFTRVNTLDADLQGLPTTNTITFLPSGTGATFTPSAPIGQITLLASDGSAAPSVSGDYASYEDTPSLYRIFLQMQSIAGLSFSTAPTVTAELKTGVSLPMKLFAHVSDGTTHNLTVNGLIDSLPTDINVNADLDNGKIVYTASSAINEIHVTATDSLANFFARANRIDADLKGLPTTNTITFLPGGNGATFTPSSPIGQISLLASDGTGAPSVSGDYASYEDTPSLYRIFLQMQSIAGLSFSALPHITASLQTGVSLPMTLFAHIDDGTTHNLTVNGLIDSLPTNISVNADIDNGHVVYSASSTIHEIHVTATDSRSNFFTRANKLDLDLIGLPSTNTIDFLPSGTGASFNPSSPITSISLLASNGANAPSVSGDYASYEDTPSLYRIYLQMLGLNGLSFSVPSNGAISGTIKTANQQVFNLLGHVSDGSTYDVNATGQINKLPSWIDFSMTPSSGGNSVVDYNTHGQVINSVTLDASGLPLPFGADTVHAEIDHIPSHITVTIPGSGGTAIFDPHGDTINDVLVQAWPHTSSAFNGVSGHQTVYANLQTGRFTADIKNIGFTKINTDPNNLSFQYDISSAPLDFNVTTDTGTYFKGQISNPEPATITVNTNNQTKIVYTVNQSGANYTGNGFINEIDVQTNAKGYLDAALQHIAPRLTICVDGGGSAPCQPGFVPRGSFQDTDGNTWYMPASLFNFSVVPQNFNGSTPSTRFRLDGTYCFDETDAATCLDSGQKKKRIVISDLEFGKVQVGVGKSDDDCTLCTAGRLDAYFDTDNTNISGDVQYFSSDGDDSPFVHYHTDANDQGIAAQNLFEFVQYCIVCLNEDNLDIVSGGSFTCNGSPHLDIDIPVFDNIDVLSGSFISIC